MGEDFIIEDAETIIKAIIPSEIIISINNIPLGSAVTSSCLRITFLNWHFGQPLYLPSIRHILYIIPGIRKNIQSKISVSKFPGVKVFGLPS